MIGSSLGPYRIVEPLGRGGMAAVYKAYQPSLDRYVAIKVLPAHLTGEPGFAERFKREARAVAKLEHPHILAVHDYGQEGDLTYIAMRYVEGGTLKDLLGKPLELHLIVDLIGQIAEALDHAHEHGIIHRDVKPSNVLLDRGNWALLTDFGVARMVEATQQLTGTGVGVGTPAYMSPEQGQGKKVDRRSDVYSLGVVLYEMLTGRVPFEAETPLAVVWKHVNEPLPLPRSINPEIPEAVERVVLKAMAKAPGDRYEKAFELRESLVGAIRAGKTTGQRLHEPGGDSMAESPAPEPPGAEQAGIKRRVGLMAALLAIGAVVGLLLFNQPARQGLAKVAEQARDALLPGRDLATATGLTSTSGSTEIWVLPEADPSLQWEVYDDFEDPDFAGSMNYLEWLPSGECQAAQEGGTLKIEFAADTANLFCPFFVRKPELYGSSQELGGIGAQLLVPPTNEYIFDHVLMLTTDDIAGTWSAFCGLTTARAGLYANFWISEEGKGLEIGRFPISFGDWHALRLTVDWPSLRFTCWADNERVGSIVPTETAHFRSARFRQGVVVVADRGTGGMVVVDDLLVAKPSGFDSSGVYLAELQPIARQVGFGRFSVGKYEFESAIDFVKIGDPIEAHAVEYDYGIYAHAPSRIVYRLDGLFSKLHARVVMLNRIVCGDGSVFVIELDGEEKYRSWRMFSYSSPIDIVVDVSGGQELALITTVGPANNRDCDWALWGDPRLTRP